MSWQYSEWNRYKLVAAVFVSFNLSMGWALADGSSGPSQTVSVAGAQPVVVTPPSAGDALKITPVQGGTVVRTLRQDEAVKEEKTAAPAPTPATTSPATAARPVTTNPEKSDQITKSDMEKALDNLYDYAIEKQNLANKGGDQGRKKLRQESAEEMRKIGRFCAGDATSVVAWDAVYDTFKQLTGAVLGALGGAAILKGPGALAGTVLASGIDKITGQMAAQNKTNNPVIDNDPFINTAGFMALFADFMECRKDNNFDQKCTYYRTKAAYRDTVIAYQQNFLDLNSECGKAIAHHHVLQSVLFDLKFGGPSSVKTFAKVDPHSITDRKEKQDIEYELGRSLDVKVPDNKLTTPSSDSTGSLHK